MDLLLTNHQVEDIAGAPLMTYRYNQFANSDNLDDMFNGYDNILISYDHAMKGNTITGHWCCLKKLDNKSIVFFDSYGEFPDSQLDNIDKEYREENNMIRSHLSHLLIDSKFKNIYYNQFEFQCLEPGINTCGRWCGLFLRLAMKPEPFKELIDHLCNMFDLYPDELVTYLTQQFI
jgi:hypothetical protein